MYTTDNFSFDPLGGLIDKDKPNLSRFDSKGIDAILNIRVKNLQDISTRTAEIFNSLGSIVKYPNNTRYYNNSYSYTDGKNAPPQPLTTHTILGILGAVAVAPETGLGVSESAQQVPTIAIFSDKDGSLCFARTAPLLTWNNISDPSQIADIVIQCAELPYRRFFDDLSGLVMLIEETKMIVSNTPYQQGHPFPPSAIMQLRNPLEITRKTDLGPVKTTTIEPSDYIDQKKPQSNVAVITKKFFIDKNTGIIFDIQAQTDVLFVFKVKMFINNDEVIKIDNSIKHEPKQTKPFDQLTEEQVSDLQPLKLESNELKFGN